MKKDFVLLMNSIEQDSSLQLPSSVHFPSSIVCNEGRSTHIILIIVQSQTSDHCMKRIAE